MAVNGYSIFLDRMKKTNLVVKAFFFLLIMVYMPGHAQDETQQKETRNLKVKKNHFFAQYPDDFFFIQCGLQDKRGNLWFGSSGDGVYCYDGKSFINYTTYDGLCHNDVLCILEDRSGNIWFGTRGGACKYSPAAGKMTKNKISSFPIYSNANNDSGQSSSPSRYSSGFSANFVWCIFQDKSGKMWFGTNDGVFLYDAVNNSEIDNPVLTNFLEKGNIENKNNLHLKMVQDIIEDKSGNIWFASGDFTGEGICVYNGKSIFNFKPDSVASFRSILKTKDGKLLFRSFNKGIFKISEDIFPGESADFINYTESIGLKNYSFTAMLEDKKGNLWLGTDVANDAKKEDAGIWRYDGKSLTLFTTNNGLSNNSVFCIVEDKSGNIWFGTRKTGLCFYDGKFFKDFTD